MIGTVVGKNEVAMPISAEFRATDVRAAVRASIYRAATLFCDGSSSPVKLRNISTTGALVESDLVPPVGTPVQLARGALMVRGHIAWAAKDRCGLKFVASVDVEEWQAPPRNIQQQRVDEVVRLVKAGAVPLPTLARLGEPNEAPDRAWRISPDLQRVSDLLGNLAELLANDRDLLKRHGPALQNLDIAMQMLAALNAVHGGEAGHASKLAGLRRSADQALQPGG